MPLYPPATTTGYTPGGTDVAVADGGTGASTAAGAATNLGLGTGDSPQFTAVNIGAATDTTVTRTGAGDIAVEGNALYRAGGTDVAVADGGTGSSTAANARTALGLAIGTDVDGFASTIGQAEAEAGVATTIRNWTALRVAQAIAALASGSGIPASTIAAKGDLLVGTANDTVGILTVGANDTIPMADSSQTTGLKYVASQTPSTQAFSDSAAEGTADTYARGDHKHGMPSASGTGSVTTVKDEGSNLSTAVVSLDFVGAGVTATGTTAVTVTIPGGGGSSYGQVYSYPTTFTGDVINGSSTTPFVDTSAFDVKEVLNSRILHLTTLGASKDQRVRVTLGTTKAAAFDVTTAVAFNGMWWGSGFDAYLEVRGSTAADAQIFIARLGVVRATAAGASHDVPDFNAMRVGGSSISAQDANLGWPQPVGETTTFRFVRDGSNVISFTFGRGTAPMALSPIISNINVPFTATVSGTLARIEYSIHTGSGPGSTAAANAYVDYLASV